MEQLRKLQDLLAKVDYNQTTRLDHREIYQYIEREVLSPKSSIVKQVPPLEAIIYSINNIMSPKLATRRIPDLLDLLATVEFYRKHTLDHAKDALGWNDYYKNTVTMISLSNDDVDFLNGLQSKQDSLRQIYIKALTSCCHLDIYLLWMASPPSMIDVMIRFNEYFPFLNEYCDNESPRLFHSDLSAAETSELQSIALKCCDLAQETVEWTMQHSKEGQPIHMAFRNEEFGIAFPRPYDDKKLTKLVSFYTKYVTSAAKRVQDILKDDNA